MKKIAVMEDFLTPERRKKVLAAAEKHGFAVDFYGRGKAPAEGLDQYEIIYGWCEPGDLKRATALKWYCCGFAGVDLLSDDGLYANPDVMLSNSSGAYGLTISEHILMVTLMLLRHEVTYCADAAAQRFHTGQQFAYAERLGHIVIGTNRKAADLVLLLSLGAEDDNADLLIGAADGLAQGEAVHARQHHIQNDKLRLRGAHGLPERLRGFKALHFVSAGLQCILLQLADGGIVLYNIDHPCFSSVGVVSFSGKM